VSTPRRATCWRGPPSPDEEGVERRGSIQHPPSGRLRAMAQTILITGASSGLGAEMARQFAAKG
jgi:hypothetical protein